MEKKEHWEKAARLEQTMAKLSCDDDCETVIENCMVAGTHLINCLLHHYGVLDGLDVVHSDLVKIDRTKWVLVLPHWEQRDVPGVVAEALKALKRIEGFRPVYVRGRERSGAVAMECLALYKAIKDSCQAALAC